MKITRAAGEPADVEGMGLCSEAERFGHGEVRRPHIGQLPYRQADCGYLQVRRSGRYAHYIVADPRVGDLVMLARSLAADNAAALAACVRIPPAPHATKP